MDNNQPAQPTPEDKEAVVKVAVKDVEALLKQKGYVIYALNGQIVNDKDGNLKQQPAQIFVDLKPEDKTEDKKQEDTDAAE